MSEVKPMAGGGRLREANLAQCAEFFDVSLPAVQGWVRRGCPVVQRGARGAPWVIDLLAVAEWRFGGARQVEQDPEALEPSARKAWYEGEARRLEIERVQKQLIPVGEVERVVATAYAAFAQGVRAIPDNLERRVGLAPAVAAEVDSMLLAELDAMAGRLAVICPAEVLEGAAT